MNIRMASLLLVGLSLVILGPALGQQQAVKPKPTRANVRYGPHERNVLDFWRAKSDGSTPVVIFIHGGGWNARDKSLIDPDTLTALLEAGISVAAVNYRLLRTAPFPAPFHDVARAVQFLRSQAAEWKLDNDRFAAYGGSAGGCMSMWLAYHDDLANPDSQDPVARESTRLHCAAGMGTQTSIDPFVVAEWLGEFILSHPNWTRMYGVASLAESKSPKFKQLRAELSAITHVSKDDPPVFLTYGIANVPLNADTPRATAIHHPRFGYKLKEVTDRLGLECVLRVKGEELRDDYRGMVDFLRRKLKGYKLFPPSTTSTSPVVKVAPPAK